MLLACASAFVIPQQYTDKAQPQIQVLFAPVSLPARWVGGALERRLAGPEQPTDPRPVAAIRELNDHLMQQNAWLTQELDDLRKVNNERKLVGDIRKFCTPVPVIGSDSSNRESLAVGASSLEGLKDGMYVVYSGGIVGKLQRSGLGGGQVQLVTNKGFTLTAYFGSFRKGPDGEKHFVRLNKGAFLVLGYGNGIMVCQMISVADVKNYGIRVGDWVMLDDPDWPHDLQNRRIGKVVSIDKRPGSPLYAEIRIRPESDLKKLKEVMVLTSDK
jgi:cell shape-determining protein MreC